MKRLEGIDKLTGRTRYVDDLVVPGCLHGATVRSPAPRGRITAIRFGDAIDWSEFTVVDHRDVPGPNVVALIESDQPVLAESIVRHVHEPVVLLAHPSRDALRRAVREVAIDVDPLPPALDFRRDPEPELVQHGTDNILSRLLIAKGDVEAALARAAHVVEGRYETGAQEHLYLEPQGMLASVEDGVVVVRGSMQCPYYVLDALTHALDRDASRVRVIQAPTGGGFGGKEDFPSIIALHAALLALKSGRPVKFIYDRGEDMAVTTKRHPAVVVQRTGFDAGGRLVAQDIDVTLDGGAYVTLSPVVLSRSIIHAGGPYHCDNVRIQGRVRLTNAPPFGAFRGFGAPQSLFACERHLDVAATTLGLDPVEVRRINLIRDGQSTSTGQVIADGTDRVRLMDEALGHADYHHRRDAHASFNASHPYLRRGIGFATFYHGAGFTGAGEVHLDSVLHVAGRPDGRIEIRSANTEIGQGILTVFTRIASDRLGLARDDVVIVEADTFRVPNSGPTVASRSAMIVGRLVERACDDLRERLGLAPSDRGPKVKDAVVRWTRDHPGEEPIGRARYRKPPEVEWDETTYRGDAYAAFAWATYVAEVEVDLRTFTVDLMDFVAVQEIGKPLDETIARGQIQGGVVQGAGWALMEDCTFSDGAMVNHQLTNYLIPTAADRCPVRVVFHENPYEHGAQGAKGIGELPIDGAAPAILNAVASATGLDPRVVPLTPERLMELALTHAGT